MKRLLLIIFYLINSAFGFAQSAEFSIDKSTWKFEDTPEGAVVSHNFRITNTGKVPLVLSEYSVTCDCTSAKLPDDPILPGETGIVTVTFRTEGTWYFQDRTVEIASNAKKRLRLRFKVYVIPRSR